MDFHCLDRLRGREADLCVAGKPFSSLDQRRVPISDGRNIGEELFLLYRGLHYRNKAFADKDFHFGL